MKIVALKKNCRKSAFMRKLLDSNDGHGFITWTLDNWKENTPIMIENSHDIWKGSAAIMRFQEKYLKK